MKWAYFRVVSFGIPLLLTSIIFLQRFDLSSTVIESGKYSNPKATKPSSAHFSPASQSSFTSKSRIAKEFGKLPMVFEANRGQTNGRVRFISRGSGYSVFLTANEAVLALHKSSNAVSQSTALDSTTSGNSTLPLPRRMAVWNPELNFAHAPTRQSPVVSVLHMKLVGVNAAAKIIGVNELPGKSNYFIGNDAKKWQKHIPMYAKVRYQGVYPGTDVIYYGYQGRLEYDFVLSPSASPKEIKVAITGTGDSGRLKINSEGDLVVSLDDNELRLNKPVIYQQIGTEQKCIDGRYVLKGEHKVGFEIGSYDRTKALVIDPTLSYSTYLGGSNSDEGSDIAVDGAGNVYVTGDTASIDFPTSNPFQATNDGGADAFVAVLDPTGGTMLYATYIGGSGEDFALGIAVDSAGNAYVAGYTKSTDFPTSNPLQPTNHGGTDAFVVALDPTGSTLLYSTYLGGSGTDTASDIAVDSGGNAYVTGGTTSTDFPISNPLQATNHGGEDAFIAALDPSGTVLMYSTYFGGNGIDVGSEIAVDTLGNAYVTGNTNSIDFPTLNAFQSTNHGDRDAFVLALDPSGAVLLYSTYLGGSGRDFGVAIAVDSMGAAYVTGFTTSTDFPTSNPFQPTNHGSEDAFVAKLDPTGNTLIYSTYLGGTDFDVAFNVAVDGAGNAYLTGSTASTNFPTANPLQPTNRGFSNAFVAVLDPIGSTLLYSTYLGGSGDDYGYGIAVDNAGAAYVTGNTTSIDFPLSNPWQPTNHGGGDAFIAKITP